LDKIKTPNSRDARHELIDVRVQIPGLARGTTLRSGGLFRSDRLHRSIAVARLQGGVHFVSETVGSISIRKENPTFDATLYAPADNSPLIDHFAACHIRSLLWFSSRKNLRRRHKHARNQKANGDVSGNVHCVLACQTQGAWDIIIVTEETHPELPKVGDPANSSSRFTRKKNAPASLAR
jgi:hypothetical protein